MQCKEPLGQFPKLQDIVGQRHMSSLAPFYKVLRISLVTLSYLKSSLASRASAFLQLLLESPQPRDVDQSWILFHIERPFLASTTASVESGEQARHDLAFA